jgi:hypothetical protein
VTGCVGFGACVTAPIASFIVAGLADVVLAAVSTAASVASTAAATANLVIAEDIKDDFTDLYAAEIGVTYESGSADYAEWLLKANPEDDFVPGQIVGIRKGAISLDTYGADKLFVISTKPIVLGNAPFGGEELYEKAAFMGQVPVAVIGPVSSGDFIIPSGRNDGYGKAVGKEAMSYSDLDQIVGVAWEDGMDPILNRVNTAVGFSWGVVGEMVAQLELEMDVLRNEMKAMRREMHTGSDGPALAGSSAEASALAGTIEPNQEIVPFLTMEPEEIYWITPDSTNIVIHEVTPLMMDLAMERAMEIVKDSGVDMENDPVWGEIMTNPSFKAELSEKMRSQINEYNTWSAEVNSAVVSSGWLNTPAAPSSEEFDRDQQDQGKKGTR